MSLHGAVVVIIIVVVVGGEERQAWQGARGNDFSNSAAENGRKGSFRMEMTERGEGSTANPLKSQLSAVRGWETSERTEEEEEEEEERVELFLPSTPPIGQSLQTVCQYREWHSFDDQTSGMTGGRARGRTRPEWAHQWETMLVATHDGF